MRTRRQIIRDIEQTRELLLQYERELQQRDRKAPRKVQRMTLHRFIMREAAACSRMKPRRILKTEGRT